MKHDSPRAILFVMPDPTPAASGGLGRKLTKPSVLALILANLVPLAGVLFLGWALRSILPANQDRKVGSLIQRLAGSSQSA